MPSNVLFFQNELFFLFPPVKGCTSFLAKKLVSKKSCQPSCRRCQQVTLSAPAHLSWGCDSNCWVNSWGAVIWGDFCVRLAFHGCFRPEMGGHTLPASAPPQSLRPDLHRLAIALLMVVHYELCDVEAFQKYRVHFVGWLQLRKALLWPFLPPRPDAKRSMATPVRGSSA